MNASDQCKSNTIFSRLIRLKAGKRGWPIKTSALFGLTIAGTVIWASIPKVSVPERAQTSHQPTVAVVRAQAKTLSDFITLQAEFRPYQEIRLHAKVSGYVSAINVDIGDHVTQGQVLATLEIPELEDGLNKAEAAWRESQQAVIKAEADYRDADLEYQRLAEVAKQHVNLVAQQQLDNTAAKDEAKRGSLGMAKEHVAECRAEVGRINSLLAYSKITVPFNGVITNRYADLGSLIQAGIVRIDGQRSVYLPVLKSGSDANTISVVEGIKQAVSHLLDVPKQLVTKVVFDQSVFVKTAIENLIHEGLLGLVLTGIMILVFLGNFRATLAVFLAIPLSALATFIVLSFGNSSINSMILGGLALVFSRLIDNSVVVLENIFRHIELGEPPEVAAEKGGKEAALPVLAATLTTR